VFTIQFIREFARLGAPEPPPTSDRFDPLCTTGAGQALNVVADALS
jgi:hypothetical protein